MKIKSFKQFLLMERDINDIIAKTKDVPADVLQLIYNIVGDKHARLVVPLARLYKKAKYDVNELPGLLAKFEKNKVDINKYKAFDDLKKDISGVSEKEASSSYVLETDDPRNTVVVPKTDPDFPLVWKTGKWKIFELKSYEAAIKYTPRYNKRPDGTFYNNSSDYNLGWCTGDPTNESYFKHYTDDRGKLYVFAENNKISYQLFKNRDSQQSEFEYIKKKAVDIETFMDEHPELAKFFTSIGFKKIQAFNFRGRRIPYIINDDGDIEIETVDVSDMGLTTLMDLPWNDPEVIANIEREWLASRNQ